MKKFKEFLLISFLFIVGNIFLVPIGTWLVSKWEGCIETNSYYDVLFGMLWLLTVVYYIYKIDFALIKGYIASSFYSVLSILLGITYVLQRCCEYYFLFWGFSFLPNIKYLDFILLGVILNTVLFICNKPHLDWLQSKFPKFEKFLSKISVWIKSKLKFSQAEKPKVELGEEKRPFFYLDDPEDGLAKNKLSERQKAAEELALRITETNSKKAFAIAIEGEWGSGKTVFLKEIQKALEDKAAPNQIIIAFNPWDGNMPNSIVENFFGVLSNTLGNYSTQLAWQINSYMDNLISSNDNTVINGILHFFKSFFGSSALSTKFDHINDTLIKLNKQLIIFIDDLDRLDKPEIWEVVKLIRNTANFHNTIFVAAFDRDYVVEALNEFNKHKTKRFLEKIFQLEIQIPAYSHKSLRDFFKKVVIDELNHYLTGEKEKGNESDISLANKGELYNQAIDALVSNKFNIDYRAGFTDNLSNLPENLFDKYISTYRDVYRFVNSFKLKIPSVEGELCLIDFLIIELLRLKYPDITNELYWHSKFYLHQSPQLTNNPGFFIINSDTSEIRPLDNMIKRVGYDINSNDSDVIKSTLYILFGNGFANSDKEKTIRLPSNFHKYFSYGLFDSDFPHKEFDKFRQQKNNEGEFLETLKKWYKEGKAEAIFEKFENIQHYDSKEDIEKILGVLFRLYNDFQEKIQSARFKDKVIFIYNNEIMHEVFDYKKEEYINFVLSLFENKATTPYDFAASVLSGIDIINNENKLRILLKYFEEYLGTGNNFNIMCQIYYNIIKLNKEKEKELKPKMLNFIKNKALKSFFENQRFIDHSQRLTSVLIRKKSFIFEFFNNQEEYETFLAGLPDSEPYIIEYKNYYAQCKDNNFDLINFPFKHLSSP
ncbi:MAG TPA: P-loop NTPase fold protein [Chitinophagales bacterium]|nr:P-loop NTPase fold protein [Chitinophagales bacterium]